MKAFLAKLPKSSQLKLRKTPFLRLSEFIGLGGMVVLIGVAVYVFNLAVPVHSEVVALDRKYREIRPEIDRLQHEMKKREYETQKVGEALKKLETFEDDYLRERRAGQLALLDEINEIGRKTSIQLSDGISMSPEKEPLPLLGAKKKDERVAANEAKKEIVYPTVKVNFGVTGPYANVRAFLRELEQSKQFIVLELLEVSQEMGNTFKLGGAPSDMVQINLSLTAYYRRDK